MILNIARKELKSLFASPMGWTILALLMALLGNFYLTGVNKYFEVMSGAVRPARACPLHLSAHSDRTG